MEKNHFKIKSITDLETALVGDIVPESDFCSLTPGGKFVQLEHVEVEEKTFDYKVKPGIWSIKSIDHDLTLIKTKFSKEAILDEFVHTETITSTVEKFFNKLHVYKEFGIDVPKRGILLYGAPGCGKSSAIKKVAEQYARQKSTAVILWATDKLNSSDVKDFISSFKYIGVDKLILIAEDIGGVEIDQVKIQSQSSLLALLDNQEQTFSIPVAIIATTNYPEVFMGSLTNRPGRFDTKIEVGYPSSSERAKLLEFYLKDKATDELQEKIKQKKYIEFSTAHIKETVLRSAIFEIPVAEAMDQILEEIKQYKDLFQKKTKLGIGNDF